MDGNSHGYNRFFDMMENKIKLFVPLGTQKFPFNRLVKALNGLVESGVYTPSEIVMQSTVYEEKPKFIHFDIIPLETFNSYLDNAEVIITHSGVNSIISSMNRKKPLIIVPRMKKYGEHVDDHQIEIADLMEQKFNVLVAKDTAKLAELIKQAKRHQYKQYQSKNAELIEAIRNVINN